MFSYDYFGMAGRDYGSSTVINFKLVIVNVFYLSIFACKCIA